MGEIINTNTAIETQPGGDTGALLDITQSLLADARTALNSSGFLTVRIPDVSPIVGGVYTINHPFLLRNSLRLVLESLRSSLR